jgi:hypothetical protein
MTRRSAQQPRTTRLTERFAKPRLARASRTAVYVCIRAFHHAMGSPKQSGRYLERPRRSVLALSVPAAKWALSKGNEPGKRSDQGFGKLETEGDCLPSKAARRMGFVKMSIAALICAAAVGAQDHPAGQLKHLSVPIAGSAQPLTITAMDIERGVQYPSVIHLQGAVEIRMPVCVVTGPGNVQHCAGEIVFHADQADLNEGTGQIEARGGATITRH